MKILHLCARFVGAAAVLLVGALTAPAPARAQAADQWQFQAIVYGYFPDIGGTTSFPAGAGSSISVDSSKILDNLNFTFMGTFEARKGRLGVFTDLIYMDVSGDQTSTRNFQIGMRDIPAGVSANVDLGIKATIWTLAGEYAAVSQPSFELDVLAGARLLDVESTLSYSLSADVGPLVGPGRSGSTSVGQSFWDGIIGVKGRVAFGPSGEWFVPYYADVGTGQSDLTWQVFGGLGYRFASWGSVLGGWRYLAYDFKSGSAIQDLNVNGPMIGVAFAW